MSSLLWLPTTICAFLIPFALRLLPMFRNPSSGSGPHPRPPPAPTPLRTPISAFLALYILYTLYTLIFARPPNLFTSLRLPLNTPQSTIHSALLQQHLRQLPPDDLQSLTAAAAAAASANGGKAVPALPQALEKLLARLASSDARMILVRCVPSSCDGALITIILFVVLGLIKTLNRSYGQRVIQTCSHCVTEADYALHALPPALLSYTLAAAMLGSVTVRGTARESRRSVGLMLLVFAALVEAYWAYTVPIRIPSRQKQQNGSRDETIMVCNVPLNCTLPPYFFSVARRTLVPPARPLPSPPTHNPPPSPATLTTKTTHDPNEPVQNRRCPTHPHPLPPPKHSSHPTRPRTAHPRDIILDPRALHRRCCASRCWCARCRGTRWVGYCALGGEVVVGFPGLR
jgi:hypothetical protein